MLAGAACVAALAAPRPLRAQPDPALAAQGWTHGEYDGIRPARFHALPDGGLRIEGEGAGSFVRRAVSGAPGCLSWRWRVDHGPPGTDLTRRGGDDRALAVAVGFVGWPAAASAWQRAQHAAAQAKVGAAHRLPRSVLIYVWGGNGREPPHFYSPWAGGLGKVTVLRPASAPQGRWFEERVDLAADWRRFFGPPGGNIEPPALQELAVGTDADDTNARLAASLDRLRFHACGAGA